MDTQSKERARVKRLILRLEEDEARWRGPDIAVSEISNDEVAMALKLIGEEKVKLRARLAELRN